MIWVAMICALLVVLFLMYAAACDLCDDTLSIAERFAKWLETGEK